LQSRGLSGGTRRHRILNLRAAPAVPNPPQPRRDRGVFLSSNDIELTLMLRRKRKVAPGKIVAAGYVRWRIALTDSLHMGRSAKNARTIDKGVVSQ